MDFEFSKDQDLVRKSVREFLAKECPKDRTRELMADKNGYDRKMWKKMAQLGFMGLAIEEAYEGTGGDFLELAIFMEEVGRNIVPSPYFATVCLCALAISEFGTQAQKVAVLPKIATKGEIWTLTLNETAADYEPGDIQLTATCDGDRYLLNGTKLFVAYANVAKKLMVAARTDNGATPDTGVTVFMVDATDKGISISEIPTAAPGKRCEVQFDNVTVSAENILGKVNGGWAVIDYMIDHGAVLKAAEMSGGVQAALHLAVRYAKERVQFGRTIGSFQAIQHRLVNMLKEVESLRRQVYEAAWNISVGSSSRLLNASAKARASEAYHRVCFDAVAIHGAIGWTREMDVSLYLLRSKDLENDCGGLDFHKERIAAELEKKDLDFLLTGRWMNPSKQLLEKGGCAII